MSVWMAKWRWMAGAAAIFAQLVLAEAGLATEPESGKSPSVPPAAERTVDFGRDIQPIFAERCNHCHGEDDQLGRLR